MTYLRVSVTDRCNMRCVYCMPENAEFIPHEEILTYDEIERIVRVGMEAGIRKVRVTGGEPLARKNIEYLIGRLAALSTLEDLSLTTNGLELAGKAKALADAGLRRVNVSLDTLNPEKFKTICRAGDIGAVLSGIRAANETGLRPVKVNVVVMRGRNDGELCDFVEFGDREDVIVRFIEYMPLMKGPDWGRLFVPRDEIIEKIAARIEPAAGADTDPNAPARYFSVRGSGRNIGIISPVSHGFCSMCNRLRLTPDGRLMACLLAPSGTDVKALLRSGGSDEEIADAFRRAAASKGPKGLFPDAARPMHSLEVDMVEGTVGRIISVNVSDARGVRKLPVDSVEVQVGHGIAGDAHAGPDPVRQISLLAMESIEKIRARGLDVHPGDFAENITTQGLELHTLPVGTRLRSGTVEFELTQIGKVCVTRCAIYYQAGDCVMPREGIFVRALSPGVLRPGDSIEIVEK